MKTIQGFSRYKIDVNGNIFDTERKRFVSYVYDRDGYKRSTLKNDNGKWRTMASHRLTALAYIPNPEGKPCATFRDGNKDNISVPNLKWVTKREAQLQIAEVN